MNFRVDIVLRKPAAPEAFSSSQHFSSSAGVFLVAAGPTFLRVAKSFDLSSWVEGQNARSVQSPPAITAGSTGDPHSKSLNRFAELKPIWNTSLEYKRRPGKLLYTQRGWFSKSIDFGRG